MSIGDTFNDTIRYYDDWMKKALPDYEALFQTAKDLLPFDSDQSLDVLDLGAGTGLFSQHVLNKYPKAKVTLVDLAEKMLDVARIRFLGFPNQVRTIVADYRDMSNLAMYDLVISSLSIHHLEDNEKAALFRQIYAHLRGSGIFINIDQTKGPSPAIQKLYWSHWLETVRQRGGQEDQIEASIQRRTTYDRDALMVDQLRWLQEAGFVDVDCIYKNYFVGVFYGFKG